MNLEEKRIQKLLKIGSEFINPEMESGFRLMTRNLDRRLLTIILLFISIPNLLFAISDVRFISNPAFLSFFISYRLLIFLGVIGILIWIRKAEKPQQWDVPVFIWTIMMALFLVSVQLTRPPDFILHYILDIIVLIAILIFIPNRFYFQIIPALFLGLGELLVLFTHKSLDLVSGLAVFISFFASLLFCSWMSRHNHRANRLMYKLLKDEEKLSSELQAALGNVKTLSGLLPVCSHCKNVRDDQGYWHQVEAYVSKHTHADFTHGICPDCIKKYYPETLAEN